MAIAPPCGCAFLRDIFLGRVRDRARSNNKQKKRSYALTSQGFSEPRRSGRSSKTPRKKCRALPPARWDLAVAAKKTKGRALLLHTAVPKFLQEFLPELCSSLDACKQKKMCCAPLCRPPKARWRFGPQVL